MEDLLISLLETFGYPVRLQGSLGENEEFPDHFFTFWNNNSEDGSFYDNAETSTEFGYSVYFYSCNPEFVYSKTREAIKLLKANGFIISGDGFSVDSGEQTHDGRGFTARYVRRT